jgi:hypothetical protein
LGAYFVFDVLETPLSSIGGGSNTGAARRFPPAFWQERFESVALLSSLQPGAGTVASRLSDVDAVAGLPVPLKPERRLRTVMAVFATHFLRSLFSKLRNRGTIYSMFIEAPVLAAVVAITLRSSPTGEYAFATALHIPAYLFLSVTVAMFLGLTNSATEVLRDRPMLRRERNCQSGAASYVAAKFVALGLVASGQCLMYVLVGNHFLEIRGMVMEHWLWMTMTAWAGTALALVVSSVVKTERAALTAVPLLLVPQMLLAGALVPFREMNRGLFEDVGLNRERGGTPVPSAFMPLRYAYEAMVVTQATQNPFELERIRLQRKIDAMRDQEGAMTEDQSERFELLKEGLRRLLAAGAETPEEAAALVARIARIARFGNKLEVETMKVWPDVAAARPASEFFVNERIDLLVREAETFRNDYRNKAYRNIFLALEKPLPFAGAKKDDPEGKPRKTHWWGRSEPEIETMSYSGLILAGLVFACWMLTSLILSYQNRRTR